MKRQRTLQRYAAGVVALGLVVAACGGDDDDETAATEAPAEATEAPAEATEEMSEEATEEMSEEDSGTDAAVGFDLSGVCPSPLVIQTDWFPEAEHGALYEMVGDDYTVDVGNKTVTGPLWASGPTPTGIDIEVRTGGPAIGFQVPRQQMAVDEGIHIGYSSLDSQILAWEEIQLLTVMAPLEINPQIIMWDADEYPDVKTIADVGSSGMTINIFGGSDGFQTVFTAQGIWSEDQVDPSYDGSPARFIAEGNIAQQGFASAEPYNYENVFEEYGKAPAFQLLHDAGYPTYSQTLAVRPDDLETLRPCLEQFIPIVQQATVDFAASPDRANAVIIDAVAQFDDFWVYDDGVANYAVETMNELGLHGNGPDAIVGNIDEARLERLIEVLREAGTNVPEDLVASEMFTNEFIDESIGF